jgi:branched-chain amino acid transport system substrate-binding protein
LALGRRATETNLRRNWVRKASVLRTTAVVAVAVAGLAACSNGSGNSNNSSGGLGSGKSSSSGGSNQTYKIGFQGALSGDNQQLGINEINAVELAVKQANEKGDLPFKLEVVKSDDGGTPDKAPAAASALLQDPGIVGVVGPIFSGPTKAVAKTYADAGMPLISPSATNPTLTSSGFTTFHRVAPPDSVEGPQAGEWLAKKAKNVFVVDDTTEYGKGAADQVAQELQSKGVKVERQSVPQTTQDYGAVAQAVTSSGAQAMFYGGYYSAAALFAKALKTAGYKGLAMSGNGSKDQKFADLAGAAGEGWYFSCGCQDATTAPAAKTFAAAYKQAYSVDPSTYSPEAYDATNAMIQAIKDAQSKGKVTRQSVEEAVNALDFQGITTHVKFLKNGEVEQQVINLYKDTNGQVRGVGDIKQAS